MEVLAKPDITPEAEQEIQDFLKGITIIPLSGEIKWEAGDLLCKSLRSFAAAARNQHTARCLDAAKLHTLLWRHGAGLRDRR
jgi:hypothetical protein